MINHAKPLIPVSFFIRVIGEWLCVVVCLGSHTSTVVPKQARPFLRAGAERAVHARGTSSESPRTLLGRPRPFPALLREANRGRFQPGGRGRVIGRQQGAAAASSQTPRVAGGLCPVLTVLA